MGEWVRINYMFINFFCFLDQENKDVIFKVDKLSNKCKSIYKYVNVVNVNVKEII